jgi:hypothetical protein
MEPTLLTPVSRIDNNRTQNEVVLKGICSLCGNKVTFRQVGNYSQSAELGKQIAIRC